MGLQRRPGSHDAVLQVVQIHKGGCPCCLERGCPLIAADRTREGLEPESRTERHQLQYNRWRSSMPRLANAILMLKEASH
jgi:hypothetical protein